MRSAHPHARTTPLGPAPVAGTLLLLFALLQPAAAATGTVAGEHPLLAGAAEADITPRVASFEDRNGNGRFDMGDPEQALGLGDPVLSFEEGEVRVGNGQGAARFLYDPLYAHALYLEDTRRDVRIAILTADLYMLMHPDVEAIRDLVDPALELDYLLVACTHNHMGPDTLGISGLHGASAGTILGSLWKSRAPSGINAAWFLRMRDTLAGLVEQAAARKAPARMRLAQTRFDFGIRDEREPLVLDTDMTVLAVDGLDGEPIATVVQWACHPEAVLLLADPRTAGEDGAEVPAAAREAWGRTFTAGFPGYLCREIQERRGGVPLYLNGALGGMVTNLHEYVWDPRKHPRYPATADPATVPEEIRIPNDFRFAPVQGREAALHALKTLREDGEDVDEAAIEVRSTEVLVPFENAFYRLMAALGLAGYEPRALYDDEGGAVTGTRPCLRGCFLPTVRFPRGGNVRTETAYLEIGPLGIASVPAELLPELSVGLPEDFETNPKRYFPRHAGAHETGQDYVLAYPALKEQMTTPYKMVVSMAGDDLGYVIPESDFDPPHDLWYTPLAFWWYCSDSETDPHYEEAVTASREIEPRLMRSLSELIHPTLKDGAPLP